MKVVEFGNSQLFGTTRFTRVGTATDPFRRPFFPTSFAVTLE